MDTEFVVIDTDVISYIFKGDTRGEMYQPHLDNKLGVLSFMTVLAGARQSDSIFRRLATSAASGFKVRYRRIESAASLNFCS